MTEDLFLKSFLFLQIAQGDRDSKASVGSPTAQVHDSPQRFLCPLALLLWPDGLQLARIQRGSETPDLPRRRGGGRGVDSGGGILHVLRSVVPHRLGRPGAALHHQPARISQAHLFSSSPPLWSSVSGWDLGFFYRNNSSSALQVMGRRYL